ncbi:aromatic-ring-hydroxylating dioxygenase subunit beta [Natronomonas gomsonensis]|jgi:3-phenylpropionate/cinnamic acid dioxygenase small subunit|uniref:aromatic-ring-hydroxylating dioxygenase subunit beta n=1 Tax=Natronomonas gomsonensis TaxID=1046043 RepID=UPI0020CA4600|nr:aromatic-ring-hydroxylating dioxygenase subunit beta [Natronomonas gomsonensis]MCY4730633.1 aromatic-ring-hydroxylating dioxygenase subunit beta [Natronomonas gomsonensis]
MSESVPSPTLRAECEEFLYHTAELLDDRKLSEWHDLVTEDIDYRVPIRTTRERSNSTEFSDNSFHMKEDWGTLKVRTERMQSDFAWSEDPPSRTRRQVSNVRIVEDDGEEVQLKNNLLIFRQQGDETDPDILSMERHDTLRRTDEGFKLAERLVLLDHTIIPTNTLSIIL